MEAMAVFRRGSADSVMAPKSQGLSAYRAAEPRYRPVRAVLQAKLGGGTQKLYPNLNPAAALPVDREEVFKLHNFFDRYRLQRGSHPGQYVPNSKYIFVQLASGETLLHQRYRHPAIAGGQPVVYAGEAYFDNGALQWWSNASGNYRPDAGHASQADLPMDRFYTFEQILKGVHKRGKDTNKQTGAPAISA
jgi:hypothetical protein